MTKALIDADILVYRVGFTTQEEDEPIALARMDESIGKILETLGTIDYKCYLTSTDKSNYRYAIYPEYKANRTAPRPVHYDLLRNHLLNGHGAEEVFGQEADDAIGIDAGPDKIIVTIDKDLNQIPGTHFNFVKGLIYEISEQEGLRNFYRQLLTGDLRVDNIPGIPGVGPVKSDRIIGDATDEAELYELTLGAYASHFKENVESLIERNGQLLWIRRKENQVWFPPRLPAKRNR